MLLKISSVLERVLFSFANIELTKKSKDFEISITKLIKAALGKIDLILNFATAIASTIKGLSILDGNLSKLRT